MWYDLDSQNHTIYYGRLEKVNTKKKEMYVVAYWAQKESHEDAVDYKVSKFELGADAVCGDLMLSQDLHSFLNEP